MSDDTAILIVEDDDSLRLTLADILRDEGYRVGAASNCAEARNLLNSEPFRLLILDVMLPDGDGYNFCRELRQAGNQIPVLMLTARSLEDDLVTGFDSGADDYIAKPYRMKELLSRVKALLKRGAREYQTDQQTTLMVNQYVINREARTVKDNSGRLLELTPKEFDMFFYLWDNPQRAHSRDSILDAIWGQNVVVDVRTVDNFISSLKKKLALKSDNNVYIETVRGIGYRLERE